jgi:hypothetical protein
MFALFILMQMNGTEDDVMMIQIHQCSPSRFGHKILANQHAPLGEFALLMITILEIMIVIFGAPCPRRRRTKLIAFV